MCIRDRFKIVQVKHHHGCRAVTNVLDILLDPRNSRLTVEQPCHGICFRHLGQVQYLPAFLADIPVVSHRFDRYPVLIPERLTGRRKPDMLSALYLDRKLTLYTGCLLYTSRCV